MRTFKFIVCLFTSSDSEPVIEKEYSVRALSQEDGQQKVIKLAKSEYPNVSTVGFKRLLPLGWEKGR